MWMKNGLAAAAAVVTVLLLGPAASAQMPFQKMYDANQFGVDLAMAATPTSDGGYLVIQRTVFPQEDNLWLIRLDVNGSQTWKRRFQFFGMIHDVVETPDQGFAMIGEDAVGWWRGTTIPSASNALVVKVDQNGNLQWKRRLNLPDYIDGLRVYPAKGVFGKGITLRGTELLLSGSVCYELPITEETPQDLWSGCVLWTAGYGSGNVANLDYAVVVQNFGLAGPPFAPTAAPGARPVPINNLLYLIPGAVRFFDRPAYMPMAVVVNPVLPNPSVQVFVYQTTEEAGFTDAARVGPAPGDVRMVGWIGSSSYKILHGLVDFTNPTQPQFGQPNPFFDKSDVSGSSVSNIRIAAFNDAGEDSDSYGIAGWIHNNVVQDETFLWLPRQNGVMARMFGDGTGPNFSYLKSFSKVRANGNVGPGYMLYSQFFSTTDHLNDRGQLVHADINGEEYLMCHCDNPVQTVPVGIGWAWSDAETTSFDDVDFTIQELFSANVDEYLCTQAFTVNCPG